MNILPILLNEVSIYMLSPITMYMKTTYPVNMSQVDSIPYSFGISDFQILHRYCQWVISTGVNNY